MGKGKGEVGKVEWWARARCEVVGKVEWWARARARCEVVVGKVG